MAVSNLSSVNSGSTSSVRSDIMNSNLDAKTKRFLGGLRLMGRNGQGPGGMNGQMKDLKDALKMMGKLINEVKEMLKQLNGGQDPVANSTASSSVSSADTASSSIYST